MDSRANRLAAVDYHDAFGPVGEANGTIRAATHYYRHQLAEKAEMPFAMADALRGQGAVTSRASEAREIHGTTAYRTIVVISAGFGETAGDKRRRTSSYQPTRP